MEEICTIVISEGNPEESLEEFLEELGKEWLKKKLWKKKMMKMIFLRISGKKYPSNFWAKSVEEFVKKNPGENNIPG